MGRSGVGSELVPALVRVRVPDSPGPALVEAVLTRALACLDPPVVAEIVWVPVLSRSLRWREELTFALMFEPACDAVPGDDEELVRRIRRTVRKAVRREFGSRSEVALRFARGHEEVAACYRAMVGNPREVHA
ncbi:hypothetical protein [Pseudonocardia sp. MH-G8]|uniref:hypothetical protein n=1 Tax=Pseudonocardia sp. MH-G8 TaxID=1854588 RepID=UPI00117AEAFF|nr:hypothetical protein [Pseudonocardia sp. MH-G8]